jgi:hypothetical protein
MPDVGRRKDPVQIVERSDLGVRAAIYRFEHPDLALQFQVFPMIHIGDQRFYEDIRKRLKECDVVLYEGVSSVRGRILTLSYRLVARRERLGLVYQADALPRREIESRLVHADVSAPEFAEFWNAVPFWLRIAFYLGAPLIGAYRYVTATRASIARSLETNDLRSDEDVLLFDDGFESVEDALLTRRDDRLLECVLRCHRENQMNPIRAGVLYGAAHIPAVVRLLQDRLGYRTRNAEWVTVFEL